MRLEWLASLVLTTVLTTDCMIANAPKKAGRADGTGVNESTASF